MRFSLLAVSCLCFSGCAAPAPDSRPVQEVEASAAKPAIEFRLVVPEESPSSEAFDFNGRTVFLEGPQPFRMKSVSSGVDELGLPAIAFVIEEADAEGFGDWTEANVNNQIAVVIAGQVISAPTVNERLPGKGIINGGAGGLTPEELEGLLAKLRR